MIKEELTINSIESYSIEDISATLKCGTTRAKQIRNQIAEELKLKITKYLRIKKDDLFNYVNKNFKDEFNIRKENTKEEILKKIFIDRKDIKVLLNCNFTTASKVITKVKETMIENGLMPIADTILTKYLVIYLSKENIEY